jgi:phosphinothricin acetyltransferase
MNVRFAHPDDARGIVELYNHYVLATAITFEEQALEESALATRLRDIQSAGLPYLVAEIDDQLVGFAYASRWNARSAYRYSAESTVYVAHDCHAKRVGSTLYEVLLGRLKELGYHTVLAGIGHPNEASVRLHERFGFVKTALFREVGFKFGQWHDVGYWQRQL